MMEQNLMHTQNLSIGYRTNKSNSVIASDIDLQFAAGKLIAVIGANGIGKSTLLRTLTGIQPALSGKVILNNKPVDDFTPIELAQNLSVVLTEKLPPSNLTVRELVALGRQPYTNWIGTLTDTDRLKIDEVLHLVQVTDLANRKHFEISDGQLQRVLIARALAQDTPLIVLDEPTTHLDLLHKFSLFRLLKSLATATGKCILFSTHDIEIALELSDELVVMQSGQVWQGTPQTLIGQGKIDSLFEDHDIYFDREKRKFVFKNL